jgi:RNA polymerase sigma factor (TIGR02999 family)
LLLLGVAVNDITRILFEIEQGDPKAADRLLPLVYDELRRLAAARLAREQPGQTLDATALVHEAYLRLIGENAAWDCRGHFFAAAAEAMRRILVENARRKKRLRHGSGRQRVEHEPPDPSARAAEELLLLNDAFIALAREDPAAAEVAKLHVFAGLSIEQAAEELGISRAGAYRHWTYARAWLRCQVEGGGKQQGERGASAP